MRFSRLLSFAHDLILDVDSTLGSHTHHTGRLYRLAAQPFVIRRSSSLSARLLFLRASCTTVDTGSFGLLFTLACTKMELGGVCLYFASTGIIQNEAWAWHERRGGTKFAIFMSTRGAFELCSLLDKDTKL